MIEICAILKSKPWIDKSKPKPEPEKITEIILPNREDGLSEHAYLVIVKKHVMDAVDRIGGLRLRSTPSKISNRDGTNASFVAYVEPTIDRPKRIPISISGPAAFSKKRH